MCPPDARGRCLCHVVRAARDGSAEAQEGLISQYAQPLRRFLHRHTGPTLDRFLSLSDLCQEAFLRTFRGIDRLRPDASVADFEGMLFQQAHWIASEKGRQARHYRGESCTEGTITAWARRRDGSITRADEAMHLERLIGRLPKAYRDVVQARLANLSFAEIGKRLDISEACAQKRYVRGAARLSQLMPRRPI